MRRENENDNITKEEVTETIIDLKNSIASGNDNITAEKLKYEYMGAGGTKCFYTFAKIVENSKNAKGTGNGLN